MPLIVVAGLVPAIHGRLSGHASCLRESFVKRTEFAQIWITGTSPVTTKATIQSGAQVVPEMTI
jgi:hypothetical protein